MEKVHLIHDFDVPREKVFDFFSEHERLSEIYPGAFKRISNSSDPNNANGMGSIRRITNFPLILDEMITKYIAPSTIEYRVVNGGMLKYHKGIMKFHEQNNGASTRLDYTIEFESKIPFVGFISKNLLQSTVSNALSDLAQKFRDNPNY